MTNVSRVERTQSGLRNRKDDNVPLQKIWRTLEDTKGVTVLKADLLHRKPDVEADNPPGTKSAKPRSPSEKARAGTSRRLPSDNGAPSLVFCRC